MHNALARNLFITGTDTGVGKTVLTALLLVHLRSSGVKAYTLKPFCTGGRGDAELLCQLQEGELPLDQINPFHFAEPVAPLVAARVHRKAITRKTILRYFEGLFARPTRDHHLLIEGAGGLMAPLGEGVFALDLIKHVNCEAIVVAANKLGVINHTILTVCALQNAGIEKIKVVVMNLRRRGDASVASNPGTLSELLAPVPVIELPFLGPHCTRVKTLKEKSRSLNQTLRRILA